MMSADKKQRLNNLVAQALHLLEEHFDGVQIMCSRQDGNATLAWGKGSGNWYARIGLCREFMIRDQVETENDVTPQPPTKPEDGDEWRQ